MADWKIAPVQLFTTNLVALVKAALPSIPGFDTVVPQDPDGPDNYWMISHVPGGGHSGPPLTNPDVDASLVFQIDGVGIRRDQAQWTRDKVVEAILARSGTTGAFVNTLVAPSGWSVCDRMPEEGSGGVEVEGAPPNAVFTAPQRITVVVTPT